MLPPTNPKRSIAGKKMRSPGDLYNAAKSGVKGVINEAKSIRNGMRSGESMVANANATANRKVLGSKGTDEGTATKAYLIGKGTPVKSANAMYKSAGKNSSGGNIQVPVKKAAIGKAVNYAENSRGASKKAAMSPGARAMVTKATQKAQAKVYKGVGPAKKMAGQLIEKGMKPSTAKKTPYAAAIKKLK